MNTRFFKNVNFLKIVEHFLLIYSYTTHRGDFVKGVAQMRPCTARKTKRFDQSGAIAH